MTKAVVAATVMLSFISFWMAAAIVLYNLGSSAFKAGGYWLRVMHRYIQLHAATAPQAPAALSAVDCSTEPLTGRSKGIMFWNEAIDRELSPQPCRKCRKRAERQPSKTRHGNAVFCKTTRGARHRKG